MMVNYNMQMTVRDALNSAMDEEMERDDKVW
jgi:pyruvate/2-oxoglutarate/acetoin dehydrogenase E1 component